jgi:riboflavin synthase alpha subunit
MFTGIIETLGIVKDIVKEEENLQVVRNVDYEKLSIVLLAEVQKLRKEVDDLKTK